MRQVKTQPKDGYIRTEEANKARKISLWVLERAKKREAKLKKTKTFRGKVNGRYTEITFSQPNALKKLEAFCLEKGLEMSIFT
jgi:hypothetical protein